VTLSRCTALFVLVAIPAALSGQTVSGARRLSLEEALQLARPASEPVGLAEAALRRARGEVFQARSELFPQLTGSASYSRLIKSQFEGFAGSDTAGSDRPTSCERFFADATQPIGARVDSLEKAVECVSSVNPFGNLGRLPFGRANTYNLGLALSQTIFAGGRVRGQIKAANAGRRSAEIGLGAAEAELTLAVVETYFDAVLADELAAIAATALEQADSTLKRTQLQRAVGTAPEFDLLRARVTRDNQRSAVIQRVSDRDLAYLRLKQLLDLPASLPLALTTTLGDSALSGSPTLAALVAALPDTSASHRAPVRQAAEAVQAQEGRLTATRASRLPAMQVTSAYGRVAYPGSGLPSWSQFLTNWSVALGVTMPLFTGGRLKGDRLIATANLEEARLRHRQTAELAELDAQSAGRRLQTAMEDLRASEGTAEQAERAYQIAEVRYAEGLSTQTELLDARLALAVARGNRALASRDAQVARVRMALLKELPLTSAGSLAAQSGSARPATRQQTAGQTQIPNGTGLP
jgi:outer membrane protein TolC